MTESIYINSLSVLHIWSTVKTLPATLPEPRTGVRGPRSERHAPRTGVRGPRSERHAPRTGVTDAVRWPRPSLDRRGQAYWVGVLAPWALVGGWRQRSVISLETIPVSNSQESDLKTTLLCRSLDFQKNLLVTGLPKFFPGP